MTLKTGNLVHLVDDLYSFSSAALSKPRRALYFFLPSELSTK